MIGGACGDALGYPVEFIKPYQGIIEQYGEKGITHLTIDLYRGRVTEM